MAVLENFPYTNFHEMNLDWIIAKVKELDSEFNETLEENIIQYIDDHMSQFLLTAMYDAGTKTITIQSA